MDRTVRSYLKQLLDIFWLRPETALWRTLDCMLMHPETPKGEGVEFGCGDGILSYVMAGGRISDYDVFMNVAGRASFRGGKDIYNAECRFAPRIDPSGLRYRYALGADHKRGLIDKAGKLGGFYASSLVRDLNKAIPTRPDRFDWGFSNILYWLNDLTAVLREWGRIIRRGGKLYLFVPNANFKDKAWLYYRAPHSGRRSYLNYLDRGYGALIHACYSASRWESLFKSAGFRVLRHRPYMSDSVTEVWNIGTRPISHLLIGMAQNMRAADRLKSKREWVDFCSGFFSGIIPEELSTRRGERDSAFHFYVLENYK